MFLRIAERADKGKNAIIVVKILCSMINVRTVGHSTNKGAVRNVGRSTYCMIEIQVVYKDEYGDVVDKKTTTALRGITLSPGESVLFTAYSSVRDIYSANVSTNRYEEV